ncbi:GNAT family N-acetyltransferase [Ruminococcus sp. HUN007]|uniref:GNAT family N-acetyltransferase n=1 Tax=Ruminococcus sp. HUN007 TaxID=1514668 RepID=UPI0006791ED2|nr:GNAT family N-acetyltransferase [Ruminococcus sp. HUN007]
MSEIIHAPELFSERLRFTDMTEDDADFVVSVRNDPEVYKFFISVHEITIEEHLNWFKNSYIYNSDRFDWIARNPEGERVGIFGVKRVSLEEKSAEISYILSSSFYKKGYASEAVKRLIHFCFDEWKCDKVIAEIHKNNDASLKLIERLNFSKSSSNGDFVIWELKR